MTTRDDAEYFRLREYASLSMASVAADSTARSCHLELAQLYRLCRMSPVPAAISHNLRDHSTG